MSCLIVGVVWALWHALTWMPVILTGMAWYVPVDILSKISGAFMYGICYYHCRNLFVPMWLHFVMNMLANGMQEFIIDYAGWYLLLQVIAAACYIIWYISKTKGDEKAIRKAA